MLLSSELLTESPIMTHRKAGGAVIRAGALIRSNTVLHFYSIFRIQWVAGHSV